MLEPHTSRGAGNAQHALTVVNQGNVPARVTLAASDAAEALTFSFTPPTVDIEPGESVRVSLWVGLRQARNAGNGEPKPFEVALGAPERAAVKVPGAFVPLFAELAGSLDPPSSRG